MNIEKFYEQLTGEQVTVVFTSAAKQLSIYRAWEDAEEQFRLVGVDREARTVIFTNVLESAVWMVPLDQIAALIVNPKDYLLART